MPDEKSSHDDYLTQRAALDTFELAISERYDRAVLTVASGALGLSLTFIGKLAEAPKLSTRWALSTAWVSLIASVVACLTSFLTSQSALRWARNDLDEKQKHQPRHERMNPYGVATNVLNIVALVTVVMGVAMLCWFTIANMKWSEGRDEERIRSSAAPSVSSADGAEAGRRLRPAEGTAPPTSTSAPEKVTASVR